MVLHMDIDNDIPVPDKDDEAGTLDMIEKARAAANAASLLEEFGIADEETEEDRHVAAAIAANYAKDPESTSKTATPARIARTTPAALKLTRKILDDFGHQIVQNSVEVRNMVTNKLVEETENPDPRIRLRALELLGKITDVGLFTEKSEVTVTHQTSDDLKNRLREKLMRLKDVTPVQDAEIIHDRERGEP
ncbi:MAG TPA: hypothetical protein VIG24_06570 [Acidimicrobiia bacterium]